MAAADPATAARLEATDSQRIQRALEVLETTGRPLSDWLAQPAAPSSALRFARIALEPSDRAELHRRIAARFAAMIDAGLIEEVQGLRARGDLHPALPSMRAAFIAHGPAFRKGVVIPAFDNVDVYPLMARLLGIPPRANDGDIAPLLPALQPTSAM